MNRLSIMFIAGLIAAGAQIITAQQNPALDKLFAGAQHKADVEGDLKGAIEDYTRVVAGAGANRALAAQALVRMAEAYQKLGDTEAQRIYERIMREYGDQKEVVAIARAKLAVPRTLVWADAKTDGNAGMSRDGRKVAYIDWATGDLWTRELATGLTRRMTDDGDLGRSPGTYAGRSVFSPQGDRIAFAWFNQDRGRYHVRLASATGTGVPAFTVIYENEDSAWVQPYDWSADGRWIALQIERTDRTGQIAIYDTQRGSGQVLKSVPWQQASNRLQFSPDGRFLAFDLYERQNQRDVHVLATDGSRDIEAVVHPADDELLGWSPDGSRLLFFSDRSGPAGLWTLQMRDGRPSGPPRLVRSELGVPGRFAPLGLTSDGALVYISSRPKNAGIQIAGVDMAAGRLVSPHDAGAELASTNNVYTFAWSPNGQSLAVFRRVRPGMVDTYRLSIKHLATGSVREIRPQSGNCVAWMNWSADGRFFVCQGVHIEDRNGVRQDRTGVVRVDAATGQVSYLSAGRAVVLSPDSRTMYLLRDDQRDGVRRTLLIERQVASGDERELTSRPNMARLRLSPDGRLLATMSRNPDSGENYVLVVPVSGAPARELVSVPRGDALEALFWTPDGASLIVRRFSEGVRPTVVRAGLDGNMTPAPDLDLVKNTNPMHVQLSPDGRHVAYSVPLEVAVEVHRLDLVALR